MVRNTAISIKNGKLLYRLVKIYKPDEIIEFGTGLGISTAYLASAAPDTKIISIEASDEKIEFAGSELKKLGFSNIQLIRAEFDDLLPELRTEGKKSMIFIDGNHNYHATGKYFRHFRDQLNEEGIIIFDDINWSKGMGKAWNEICGDERTGISINLFFFGIVFFKKMEGKLHYNIKF